MEDRDILGPRLYQRGLHGQPKIIVKTKLGTQDVSKFSASKTMVMKNFLRCLDKRHG